MVPRRRRQRGHELVYQAGDTLSYLLEYWSVIHVASRLGGHVTDLRCAELFMTQDQSNDFIETQQFLDRRLRDVQGIGSTLSDVAEWVNFTGHAFVNVARSKGFRV